MSDNQLGGFLRACREAVTPSQVGLPEGTRRRTPGLRRSELATLAGLSVEYLARLEQGRDRRPSPAVLGALADALRMAPDERVHLRILSKSADGNACCSMPPADTVRPTVLKLLNQLDPTPAILINRLSDILAWTDAYELLAAPTGILDAAPPNLVRYAFTNPGATTVYPDWHQVADERAAFLRTSSAAADPHLTTFIDELTITAGAPFTNRTKTPLRLPRRTGIERFVHPEAGELRLGYESLELPISDEQTLIAYLPADDATSRALNTLRPGRLRAVSGTR